MPGAYEACWIQTCAQQAYVGVLGIRMCSCRL